MIRLLLVLLLLATPAVAIVDPNEMLSDPAAETRAREIGGGLRCLVCQNQSIEDSNAGLARDLRRIVRERISAGDDNAAVVGYVTARYGDYVLLKPPLNASTIALWASPIVVLLLGGITAGLYLRRRGRPGGPAPLTAAEQARLARLAGE